jgi:uncharacterized membrane protein YccC
VRGLRLRHNDPGRLALRKAARAAIVIPFVVAFADKVIQQPQTTIFAALGSFALLVLADFQGPPAARLVAYVVLAGVGAALIAAGTLCSKTDWLAPTAMALVGFAVLFSTVLNPYFAMAGWAPLLTFILPVTLPAAPSAIPDRLEGWALACGLGISAAMLVWPPRPRQELREVAARACRSLAALVSAELEGDPALFAERGAAARADVAAVRWTFASTPYRPTGAAGSSEALAFVVDELDWFLSNALSRRDGSAHAQEPYVDENRALLADVASTLSAGAATLEGQEEMPDLGGLDEASDRAADALASDIARRPPGEDDEPMVTAVERSFRVRELALAARVIGANAVRAAGLEPRQLDADSARSAIDASRTVARGYGSLRAVLLRNSVRGAAALAVAVLIARQSSLQHSFWIVLGTLSVLRSNALGTGATVVSALRGTALGLLVGVGLVLAVGTNEVLLWVLLPAAVLLAAYAPQAISFAAGQAGFTITLLILFNIIQPTGWSVGLIRIEDVTIGFGVSLVVGALFWPRGAAALMRRSLASSYARSADYMAAAVQHLIRGSDGTRARRRARAAADRLDDVFRQFLGELSGDRTRLEGLAVLLAGATRVRLAADSLWSLADGSRGRARYAGALDIEVREVRSWYTGLGEALGEAQVPPPPDEGDRERRVRVLSRARETAAADRESGHSAALALLWAAEHLDNLRSLELQLVGPAGELAGEAPRGLRI